MSSSNYENFRTTQILLGPRHTCKSKVSLIKVNDYPLLFKIILGPVNIYICMSLMAGLMGILQDKEVFEFMLLMNFHKVKIFFFFFGNIMSPPLEFLFIL